MTRDSLTTRARKFAALNRSSLIASGAWLDKDRRHVRGHPDTWVKLRLRFDNGQQITLNLDDKASLDAAGIKPRWRMTELASVGEHAQRENSRSEVEARRAADAVPAKQADAQPLKSE